jgi:hypothetical protein
MDISRWATGISVRICRAFLRTETVAVKKVWGENKTSNGRSTEFFFSKLVTSDIRQSENCFGQK